MILIQGKVALSLDKIFILLGIFFDENGQCFVPTFLYLSLIGSNVDTCNSAGEYRNHDGVDAGTGELGPRGHFPQTGRD